MSGIKLVVFDIAGTIIEDHGEVIRAFARGAIHTSGDGLSFPRDLTGSRFTGSAFFHLLPVYRS